MTNYKPLAHQEVNSGMINYKLEGHFKIVEICAYVNLATAAIEFDNVDETASAYQVPNGKTFHILGLRAVFSATSSDIQIYESVGSGATSDLVLTINACTGSIYTNLEWAINQPAENITEDKFIVVQCSGSGVRQVWLVGYETTN